MGKKVPISAANIAFERLDLSRHFLVVDCDFTCYLVLNPSGEIPVEGTDICALHTGAWQIDAWKLLTKKDFPNQAGFVACLVWDKTLISESVYAPQCVESDIDTANSVSSLKGQPVNITGFSMASGQALPTWLVLGDGGQAVSRYNPLPVSVVPGHLYLEVGAVPGPSLEVLERFAANIYNDGEHRIYKLYPRRGSFTRADNSDWFYFNEEYWVTYAGSNTYRSFLSSLVESRITVDSASGLISAIYFSVAVVALGTSTTTVTGELTGVAMNASRAGFLY